MLEAVEEIQQTEEPTVIQPRDRTPAEMAASRARVAAFLRRPESQARIAADRARTPRSER